MTFLSQLKSKILIIWLLLFNFVFSFCNNPPLKHSIQTSLSFNKYQNYNRGKAITVNYRYPISNWFNILTTITIADGKPKGNSIDESYDYSALNLGCDFQHSISERYFIYAGTGVSGSWFVMNKIMYQIIQNDRNVNIHLINGTYNIGYFLNFGFNYWITNNLGLNINYSTSYMSKEKHNIHFIGIGCRINIVD